MKKLYFFFTLIFIASITIGYSQSIGINNNHAVPDSSAILDVQSTSQGFLLPRMTDSQRIAIVKPATGLLVYHLNASKGFYYNSGTPLSPKWVLLAQDNILPSVDAGSDTTISLARVGDRIRLKGSATDVDGTVISYLWSQVSGPKPAVLSSPGSASTDVDSLSNGTYVFQLMATDNWGATSVKKVSISVSVPSVNLLKGLVAFYPFYNNTNDSSGNNNNGTLVGGASLSFDQHGNSMSALSCNGSGQWLVVNNNGKIFFDTALTISYDVMIRSYSRHHFVAMVQHNTGYGASFGTGTVIPNNKNLTFTIIDKSAPCNNYHSNSQTSPEINSQFPLQPESWYNIICTFNKGILKTYVNGRPLTSTTTATTSVHSCLQSQLVIGGWTLQDPGASLNGKIDNVRLYDREINKGEIEELSKLFR